MGDSQDLRALIERAVSDTLDAQLTQLRQSVVQAVLGELESAPAAAPATPAAAGGGSAVLDAAVSSIHDAGAQADILRALLDGAANFSGRAALLVLKGGTLNGWQSRGFPDDGAVKKLALDSSRGLAGRAVQDRTPAAAAAAEFDSAFISAVGNPVDGNAIVLPLVVKDKVVAALYADAGTHDSGRFDVSALQLLVRSTGHWLELIAFRKAGAPSAETAPPEPPPPARVEQPVVAAAVAAAPPPAPVAAAPPPPPPTPEPAAAAEPAMSPEDAEVHKKAKRFAKLLVDEIKLYNQAKVAEGRKNKDLYDRLKEDIDKSRATYEKRFGSTVAASADYFNSEVVRILAENDSSLLGANYPR